METIKILQSQLNSETLDATALFISALKKAKKSEQGAAIEFEKGVYHFYKENAQSDICYTSNTDTAMFPEKTVALNIKGHKNLTVEGNRFLIEHDNVLRAKNTDNIVFRNNTVVKLNSSQAEETIKAFAFENCGKIEISDNSFDDGVDSAY